MEEEGFRSNIKNIICTEIPLIFQAFRLLELARYLYVRCRGIIGPVPPPL